jgi:hypothetical protein
MSTSPATLRGVVRGATVELERPSGLPDGQPVTVTLAPIPEVPSSAAGLEALRNAAGSWSDDPEGLDRFLRWNRDQRQRARPEIEE